MNEHLTNLALDVGALIAATEDVSSGALAILVGTVREENNGRQVVGVTYEAHPSMAARALARIEREVCEQFGVGHCRIVHRTGLVSLGEASVVIVVRSAHRAPAFAALRYAIEELKARVPIWKFEHYEDGDAAYLGGTPLVSSAEKSP